MRSLLPEETESAEQPGATLAGDCDPGNAKLPEMNDTRGHTSTLQQNPSGASDEFRS